MNYIFNTFLTWFVRQRIDQIEFFIKNPMEAQQKVFLDLITKAKNTEWGKKFHYQTIKTIKDFKNRIPIQDYETLKPFINRMMKGEQNILWNSEISWFAKSSGTTSDKSKFIPVSEEAMGDCHFKGSRDLMSIYCNNNPDTKIFGGKSLIMGGSSQVNQMNEKSYYGDVSAVMMSNMPFIVNILKTPDLSIAMMENWDEKIKKIAQNTVKEDVTNIVGVPTWTLVLIKRIFEITGKKNLSEVWQNLELYIHGGVSFTPYREQFEKLISSPKMKYYETYNASEGFFGIQNENNAEDLLLMLDYGIFYEFLPMEEIGKENAKTLQLDEVELNKNYAIVISSNAGLWRYKIGDTVKFTSLSPFKIQVTGRTKHFINAFGEEVIIDNSDKAIAEASKKTKSVVREYTVAPIYFSEKSQGGHEWLIEFEKEPNDLNEFTKILDESLKAVNSDYEAKRFKNMALQIPLIRKMKDGTFYNWLKSKGKLGGQNKVPRLSNDRKFVEEILNFSAK